LRLTQKLSKKGRFAKVSPLALPGGGRLVRIRVFKMGFIKEQQKRLAVRFLSWQYEKKNLPMPTRIELERHAAGIVEDAHRIARERGRKVMSIIKEMIADIKP
jgi:hypothetical protein